MDRILDSVLAWDHAGPVSILLLLVLLIAFNVLVPGKWVKLQLKDKNDEIAELRATVRALTGVGPALKDVLDTVRRLAEERAGERSSKEADR